MSLSNKLTSLSKTFLVGLLTLLPLLITVVVITWGADLIASFLGPNTTLGEYLTGIGLTIGSNETYGYIVGILCILVAIFLLGSVVQFGLQERLNSILRNVIMRIPLIGNIYGLADKFVSMVDQQSTDPVQNMSPVWCFFGKERTVAVLALLPSTEQVFIDGRAYLGVLIPSSPVPVGGGLLFLPVDWVKPAEFGIDGLTSIYISMGVSAPSVLQQNQKVSAIDPKSIG